MAQASSAVARLNAAAHAVVTWLDAHEFMAGVILGAVSALVVRAIIL